MTSLLGWMHLKTVQLLSGKGSQTIVIRFPDRDTKKRAVGFLAGRFSFTTYAFGEVLVPDQALSTLAREKLAFTAAFNVEGPASYAQSVPALRNAASAPAQ